MIADYDHYATCLINEARSMGNLVDRFIGAVRGLEPIETAFLALTISDRMRGGKVGGDLARPEIFFVQMRARLMMEGLVL